MKVSKKLIAITAAALLTVPAVGMAYKSQVSAATNQTYGKNSKVKVNKTIKFVDQNGKKTNKTAKKGGEYTIWNVKKINGKYYFSIQTDLKYWLPASATTGSVKYGNTTIKTSAGSVTVETANKKTKVATKTTYDPVKKAKKATKKSASKKTAKKTTKQNKIKSTPIVTIRKTSVYDQNGKKAKTYLGSKKWTTLGKNVKLMGHGTKTIKSVKYYALEPNHYYVKASDVKTR